MFVIFASGFFVIYEMLLMAYLEQL